MLPPVVVYFIGAAVLGTAIYWPWDQEVCNEKWINFNKNGLKNDLKTKIFGQHVAAEVILKAVTGFLESKNPKKPLVLSLHGPTGTGKNFMSQFIAENIYKKGMESSFVHLFSVTAHFLNKDQMNTYKIQLSKRIQGTVSVCPRSMFIFDEMDKMHPELIDTIKPFLDFYDNLDGVSYRKAIFIFLSNDGAKMINDVTLKFWKDGREREEIQLKDLDTGLSQSVFNNEDSGFWHTSLIDKHLVDFFVPFLPLEYKHVIQCGLAEMAREGLTTDNSVVKQMADELVYFPEEERIFSHQGCKRITNKLYFHLNKSNEL